MYLFFEEGHLHPACISNRSPGMRLQAGFDAAPDLILCVPYLATSSTKGWMYFLNSSLVKVEGALDPSCKSRRSGTKLRSNGSSKAAASLQIPEVRTSTPNKFANWKNQVKLLARGHYRPNKCLIGPKIGQIRPKDMPHKAKDTRQIRLENARINKTCAIKKQALLRPKGNTVKVKYLSMPLNGQEKPRYIWCSKQISTWWYPDLRSHVKNHCPSSRTWDRERRSSYLNLNLTRKLLTCLRSMTKRNFFPSATDKGLTQNGGTLCSTMQPLAKSSEMACVTKSGCWKADLLLAKKQEGGYCAKEACTPAWWCRAQTQERIRCSSKSQRRRSNGPWQHC